MNLDDLLRDTLTDDRWTLPVPADTLTVVRRKRALRRRTQAVGVVLVATCAVGAGVVAVAHSSGGQRSTLQPAAVSYPGCDVLPPATPFPGSTPAYKVHKAADWFATDAQLSAFYRGYQEPSNEPTLVPSPQASGPLTDRLVTALVAVGVPGADRLQRDEADSGLPGHITVHGTLADGTRIFINRGPTSLQPQILQPRSSDTDPLPSPAAVEPVPGTACAVAAFPGYGATVVAPDGTTTGWSGDAPLAQLKTWAIAVAQWETGHPTG